MNTSRPSPNRWLDRLGAAISLGCGLHCAVISLILMFNPALWLRLAWQGNTLRKLLWLEWGLAGLAALVAVLAFTLGWRRHRRWSPALLALAGLAAIGLGLNGSLHQRPFIGSTLALGGGLLMLLAHWRNLRALPCPDTCRQPLRPPPNPAA